MMGYFLSRLLSNTWHAWEMCNMLPLISEPYSFLQTFVYVCVIASVAVLVLVAAYFAVRRYKKGRNKGERGSGWPYQMVGSRELPPHLLGSDDEDDEDDDSDDSVF